MLLRRRALRAVMSVVTVFIVGASSLNVTAAPVTVSPNPGIGGIHVFLPLIMAGLSALVTETTPVIHTPTSTIQLAVQSARTEPRAFGGTGVTAGAAITTFKYLINIDNTATTGQRSPAPGTGCSPEDAGYPDSCNWVSVAGARSTAPIYTQGDQNDFAAGLTLPPGRYLISVSSDGYKLDGKHFSIPLESPGLLTVELQPHPVPDATIRARVFADVSPTNGAPDEPAEVGLAGFQGHIQDYIGEVTNDIYGHPLCTKYVGEDPVTHVISNTFLDANQLPVIAVMGGKCLSDVNGDLVIPHVGPNRYGLSATAPDGSHWIQTTTLEGNHDWDAWVMEGATGYDTEFVVAGEPYPAIIFGFVPAPVIGNVWKNPGLTAAPTTGSISGIVEAYKLYVPPSGGLLVDPGILGARPFKPIVKPWLALSDLQQGDTTLYVVHGNADGSFTIPNVPDGDYTLTYWDEPQNYIIQTKNLSVHNGEAVNLGLLSTTGWWTTLEGYVFQDDNRNGIMDPGEKGVAHYPIAVKKRDNSLSDRGATTVFTDQSGYYYMENAYPLTQWLVEEAYTDAYYTTGVTWQADNQPSPTTILGRGVDVSFLPVIGLGGRLDWGVHPYDADGKSGGVDPRNGGIVGTVSFDTTRNEYDPRYAVVEVWQPGIPNVTVSLYPPVACGTNAGTPCDATGRYELAKDGSLAKGKLLNTYVSETWRRPGFNHNVNGDGNCIPRDVNNAPLAYPAGQQVTKSPTDCLEAPLMGVQFQSGYSTVDGNYSFGSACYTGTLDATDPSKPVCVGGTFQELTPADYLVEVNIPKDAVGKPQYKVTKEEDINIFTGDQFIPQIPPPECVGPLHTVDLEGFGTDNYGPITLTNGIVVTSSTPVHNPDYVAAVGTYYEGQPRPLCTTKLVTVSNGRSVAPNFNLFTDIQQPARLWGLLVDDLNYSTDPKSLDFGEKAGVPFAPVGIYDFENRLITTVETDYSGLYDVLLPSSNRISCPTPSGVCANLYRFVGNDPGIPGRLNANYNPQFRTIATEFETLPGLLIPADNAPTQVRTLAQLPGGQFNYSPSCKLSDFVPQLFAVSKPYADFRNTAVNATFTITGIGFGAAAGQVLLGNLPLQVQSWSDRVIQVMVPSTTARGAQQLTVRTNAGLVTINGLTYHVIGDTPFSLSPVLDDFNRVNATTLGTNWSQTILLGSAFIQLNGNQARAVASGLAIWNGPTNVYGSVQGASFTFTQTAGAPAAPVNGSSLILKASGGTAAAPTNYIRVRYATGPNRVIVETTDNAGINYAQVNAFPVTFATRDTLTAIANADGSVDVRKSSAANVTSIVGHSAATTFTGGGRLGIQLPTGARVDNFRVGTVSVIGYQPTVYEVGPSQTYTVIQNAIDAAVASPGDALVVVYPGAPDLTNPRYNGRGAYYENLIINAPIKLQGVGPGGVYSDTTPPVPGSIIDGSAFGGDSDLATAWYARIGPMIWVGNQTVSDGQVIYLLAQNETQYTAAFNAAIDGFDIRNGDQQGQANTLNQGGAIFANAYIHNLQITNNTIQGNSSSYGSIRIGTPDLVEPDTNQHNENLRIVNNRIFANSGTNLAGAVGIYAGTDGYEVAHNDICGNFSAEYGGGLTAYGLSPNGKIHDNRVYFNQSYDEGGGIMVSGQLPASIVTVINPPPVCETTNPDDPNCIPVIITPTLSPGAGPVDIYNNLIQSNLGNDDGGGLRFLMAGNFQYNVYNNIIVNNISTHEGGGIALNDSPNVRIYNNTIMKNLTTATAVTSNGSPAPAGLSTSGNSTMLQATLPAGSPLFSKPLLFNDIFWDNRAGTRGLGVVTGLGAISDTTPINHWDLGVADGAGVLAPTYSIIQVGDGVGVATNITADPLVSSTYDISVAFAPWRNNINYVGAIMVTVDLPPDLLADYHLVGSASPAYNTGVASVAVPAYQQPLANLAAPAFDIDRDSRPAFGAFDIGADEVPALADLAISKTDGRTVVTPGTQITYTIIVTNSSIYNINGVGVTDDFPATLSGVTWTCTATAGSSCIVASGSVNISRTVNLLAGGRATFIARATVAPSAFDAVENIAVVAAPVGFTDRNTVNNTATDIDSIPTADLAISVTDNKAIVLPGSVVTYTVLVTNIGPDAVVGASMNDSFPSSLTVSRWICSVAPGSSCATGGTGNNRTGTVALPAGATATYTAVTTLSALATGTLVDTANVTPQVTPSVIDPYPGNNTATDTDLIAKALPALTVLDTFNRVNQNSLGASWSQALLIGLGAIQVNTNQASAVLAGQAIWNSAVAPGATFGLHQGTAFTFTQSAGSPAAPLSDSSLLLKVTNGVGTTTSPASFIRVRYSAGQVIVETTIDGNTLAATYTPIGTFTATYATGDRLTAVANADGSVDVWQNATYLGLTATSSFTTTGRIGIQLPAGARIDDFRGATLP